jgi:hypothetical protein
MSKIYLLLRSNRQLGPFSVEELLQYDLKPKDLIWVEGRSAGWSYPQEIEALQPFLKFGNASTPLSNPASQPPIASTPKQTTPKKIFVSLPDSLKKTVASEPLPSDNDLEKKAEALRQRAQAYQNNPVTDDSIQTKYAKDINDLEENYTGWFYEQSQRKKKQVKQKQKTLVAACLLIAVCGYAAIQYFTSPEVKENKTIAAGTITPNTSSAVSLPQPLSTVEQNIADYEEPKPEQDRKTASKPTKQNPAPTSSLPSIKNEEKTTKETTEEVVQEPKAVYTKPQEQEIKNEQEAAQKPVEEKKKGLGRFFDKLKGKKKEEAVVEEETPQRTTVNERGERTSQRRGEGNTQQVPNDVAEIPSNQIELRATEKSNDWMMGIVGQKITLTNKSAFIIQTAVVEVIYYSEENAVLEKKKVSFSNIAPKRSATLPVPDHRMASKFEYRLISATPKQDGIVKN